MRGFFSGKPKDMGDLITMGPHFAATVIQTFFRRRWLASKTAAGAAEEPEEWSKQDAAWFGGGKEDDAEEPQRNLSEASDARRESMMRAIGTREAPVKDIIERVEQNPGTVAVIVAEWPPSPLISPKRSEADEAFHEAAHAEAVKSAERRHSQAFDQHERQQADEAELRAAAEAEAVKSSKRRHTLDAEAAATALSLEDDLRQQALVEAEAAALKSHKGQ